MKVTVCEISNNQDELEENWQKLIDHTKAENSDLVLLPEMPFCRWIPRTRRADPDLWQQSVNIHEQWMSRFTELSSHIVVGTRPVVRDGERFNVGFVWEKNTGYQSIHTKYYLPDEQGFWEASWYAQGAKTFEAVQCKMAKMGFLICTEIWFTQHAREYAKQGIHLLICPRATPKASVDKWIAGGRSAAVISGAFCLSSNLSGDNVENIEFGGSGWIIEPEEGNILGITSTEQPFLSLEIDLQIAEKSKSTYPRYVTD